VPEFPHEVAYLWRAYHRIRRRKGGGFGPAPIEWPDVDAFVRLSRFELAPWEIEIVEAIDDCFMIEQGRRDDGAIDDAQNDD
jgi:hypothetical protein